MKCKVFFLFYKTDEMKKSRIILVKLKHQKKIQSENIAPITV